MYFLSIRIEFDQMVVMFIGDFIVFEIGDENSSIRFPKTTD